MRRPRPAARYSEIAFAFVAALFLAWGIAAWWPPEPPLDVSPATCRPTRSVPLLPLQTPEATVKPRPGVHEDGLPPSYERYTR